MVGKGLRVVIFTHTRTHSPFLSHSLSSCSPKSDTCKVCDAMKIKIDAESDESRIRDLTLEWECHKVQGESSYQRLKEDAAYAKSHSDTEMFTFDLEKSLPTPILSTGVVYYKRQLWTYNQGIHDCSTDRACMHMWDETTIEISDTNNLERKHNTSMSLKIGSKLLFKFGMNREDFVSL